MRRAALFLPLALSVSVAHAAKAPGFTIQTKEENAYTCMKGVVDKVGVHFSFPGGDQPEGVLQTKGATRLCGIRQTRGKDFEVSVMFMDLGPAAAEWPKDPTAKIKGQSQALAAENKAVKVAYTPKLKLGPWTGLETRTTPADPKAPAYVSISRSYWQFTKSGVLMTLSCSAKTVKECDPFFKSVYYEDP